MELHLDTTSGFLLEYLEKLMGTEVFKDFRLVGGTSLSLQLGHRKSVDIDLFADAEYGSLDFENLDSVLSQIFPYKDSLYEGNVGMGKSYFIGNNEQNLVKLDLFYTDRFVFPPVLHKNIRFASLAEIAAMKLDVIGRGGRKKDFWDLHELLDVFSIQQMMEFYFKRHPYNHTEEDLLKKIVDFNEAEDDFTPNCLRGKIWEIIKLDLEALVKK